MNGCMEHIFMVLTSKFSKIWSAECHQLHHYTPPLLRRGDLCGVIPFTTVLWPVHNPVPFKQAYTYTTENTIVCDEICIHTQFAAWILSDILITNWSTKCWVSSKIQTQDLRFQSEDDTTKQKRSDPEVRKNHLRHYRFLKAFYFIHYFILN